MLQNPERELFPTYNYLQTINQPWGYNNGAGRQAKYHEIYYLHTFLQKLPTGVFYKKEENNPTKRKMGSK